MTRRRTARPSSGERRDNRWPRAILPVGVESEGCSQLGKASAALSQEPASARPCDPIARLLKPKPPPKLTLSDKKPETDNNALLQVATQLCADPSLTNNLLDDLLAIPMRTMISPLTLQLLRLTVYIKKDPTSTIFDNILNVTLHNKTIAATLTTLTQVIHHLAPGHVRKQAWMIKSQTDLQLDKSSSLLAARDATALSCSSRPLTNARRADFGRYSQPPGASPLARPRARPPNTGRRFSRGHESAGGTQPASTKRRSARIRQIAPSTHVCAQPQRRSSAGPGRDNRLRTPSSLVCNVAQRMMPLQTSYSPHATRCRSLQPVG
jgi:hypothetical protein